MTASDVLTIITICITVVLAILSATWVLSSMITSLKGRVAALADDVKQHVESSDRRFSELFSQQRELAKQNFWLLANVYTSKNGQGQATVQGAKTFAETDYPSA